MPEKCYFPIHFPILDSTKRNHCLLGRLLCVEAEVLENLCQESDSDSAKGIVWLPQDRASALVSVLRARRPDAVE